MSAKDPFFIPFKTVPLASLLPPAFTFVVNGQPHPLCVLAAEDLQEYLTSQQDWSHNFGMSEGKEGAIIGKMFGVLLVRTKDQEVGYLAAFSGKLAGGNHHSRFVPPVFDSLLEEGFLNDGMAVLTRMNEALSALEDQASAADEERIRTLKALRKQHSIALQKQLFDHYHFLNRAGDEKSLTELFQTAHYKNPPSGAGECAAPKLLQYAFRQRMKPLAIAEFWWGQSPNPISGNMGSIIRAAVKNANPFWRTCWSALIEKDRQGSFKLS